MIFVCEKCAWFNIGKRKLINSFPAVTDLFGLHIKPWECSLSVRAQTINQNSNSATCIF